MSEEKCKGCGISLTPDSVVLAKRSWCDYRVTQVGDQLVALATDVIESDEIRAECTECGYGNPLPAWAGQVVWPGGVWGNSIETVDDYLDSAGPRHRAA